MKWTTQTFIEKSKLIHGDKYDYSKVAYLNYTTKVCIICPEHGEFWQMPYSHLNGNGCPKCGIRKTALSNTSTLKKFIEKSIRIHGNKYDYSKAVYKNNKTKVCIICPTHGEFWQKPNDHLNGNGCPLCSGKQQYTTEQFIKKAKKIHGNKYCYSKVKYVNYDTKVCIICPIHGEFWQTPHNHLNGKNCPICSKNNRNKKLFLTTDKFIAKSKQVHGDLYDYHKVNYKNSHTKVCIVCPIHGEFWQLPSHHTHGHGCPQCGGTKLLSLGAFVEKAKLVHGDRYNYSQVKYKNNRTKVKIICPKHGIFEQTPGNHLQGQGCPVCAGAQKYTTEQFIERAKEVHGNKYNYSKVAYINCDTKVCIICPKHGEFWQTPYVHITGSGCPSCNMSHMEKDTMKILKEHGIFYESQKRFEWLKSLKHKYMSLDFYLPDYNIAIECQGIQHYQSDGIFTDEIVARTKARDKLKKQLCEEHKMDIFYIKYDDNLISRLSELFRIINVCF